MSQDSFKSEMSEFVIDTGLRLQPEEYIKLRQWLRNHEITTQKLSRDFSDAVLMAKLFKRIVPKQIDLHNYPSRNGFQSKLNNWETMNKKVFSKLRIMLTKSIMEKLAKAEPGVIDTVLFEVMLMEKEKLEKEAKPTPQEEEWRRNDDVMMVIVNKQVGDLVVQVPQKMILYSIYEEVATDLNTNKAYLAAAYQKIAHLENLLKLRNERINQLNEQLEKLQSLNMVTEM
ncbi:sperm flagellar protein 1 [Teleopsis dalmanni]|uniref:sperm flagellar protein 1 n=1 Tax=Teleopsis dalmanni TaxID=139649 RepID=UPI0018CD8024|nr:sperm flagellar protein 1 [Teleopsis dalmanni]